MSNFLSSNADSEAHLRVRQLRDAVRFALNLLGGVLATSLLFSKVNAAPIHPSTLFPQATSIGLQPYVFSMILADLDGDGLKDVVAASQLPSKILWYRNNGDGTFSSALTISTGQGVPTCIFAGDIDADGKLDIAASTGLDNKIVWFKNVGGSLSAGLFNYQAGNPGGNVRTVSAIANSDESTLSVTIANIDGQGQPDILATSFGPNPANPQGQYVSKIVWYKNLGGGNFGWNPGAPYANQNVISNQGASPTSIATADLDGNGILDLIVTSENDNTLAWFKGKPLVNSVPQFDRFVISNNQLRAAGSAIGDFDGDGYPDIACFAPFDDSVTWFRNSTHDIGATAPYFAAGIEVTGLADAVNGIAVADLNGDSRLDVLSASLFDNKIAWYQNIGSGGFGWNSSSPEVNQKLISAAAMGAFTVGALDFNRDGKMDVVSGSQNLGTIAIHLNQGGQVALSSSDTAPATIMNGAKDDVLRIAMSNRGIAGDNNAQLFSLTLLLEKSAGVAMSSAEANALIESLQIFVDSNESGAFEPGADALIATVDDLQLVAGRLTTTLTPGNAADTQITPASTRNFFVVPQMTAEASALSVNALSVTHVSHGAGSTVTKDASLATILTLEYAANPDAPSAFVSAVPSIVQAWRQQYFSTISNSGQSADTANPDGDAFVNLAEFAFGMNPNSNSAGTVTVNSGTITPGAPTTVVTNTPTSVDFRALFGRRKDYAAAGLSFSVEFSADLVSWTPSTVTPTVIADNGTLEAVTVPYPLFINGKKARFFRVAVTGP